MISSGFILSKVSVTTGMEPRVLREGAASTLQYFLECVMGTVPKQLVYPMRKIGRSALTIRSNCLKRKQSQADVQHNFCVRSVPLAVLRQYSVLQCREPQRFPPATSPSYLMAISVISLNSHELPVRWSISWKLLYSQQDSLPHGNFITNTCCLLHGACSVASTNSGLHACGFVYRPRP